MSDEVQYETEKAFDCGCRVAVVKDDSEGHDYPGSPSVSFDFERCGPHGITVKDPGPVQAWMDEYAKAHPMAKAKEIEPPKARERARKSDSSRSDLKGRRAYYEANKAKYATYEMTRLLNQLKRAVDARKEGRPIPTDLIEKLQKKIDRRMENENRETKENDAPVA